MAAGFAGVALAVGVADPPPVTLEVKVTGLPVKTGLALVARVVVVVAI